jgi:hypothetical protein
MTLRLGLATLAILIIACSMPARACSLSDYVIKQADWHRLSPGGYFKIVGEVTNNCDEAAGVQLMIVFRDGAGKVTGVKEFWPASIRNIPAHSDYPFETTMDGGEEAKTMQASVIETRKWEP